MVSQVNNFGQAHVVVEEVPHMVRDVTDAFIGKQAVGQRKCSLHLGFRSVI